MGIYHLHSIGGPPSAEVDYAIDMHPKNQSVISTCLLVGNSAGITFSMERDTFGALRWIVGLLREHKVPFQISGGFGAHLYGATRTINDIDFDVPDGFVVEVAKLAQPYLVYGPVRHRDSTWEILVATLEYRGQEIDIAGGSSALIRNKFSGVMEPLPFRLESVEWREFQGLSLPVQARSDLIDYKSKIKYDEEKHLHDVQAMLAARP